MSPSVSVAAPFRTTVPWVFTLLIVWEAPAVMTGALFALTWTLTLSSPVSNWSSTRRRKVRSTGPLRGATNRWFGSKGSLASIGLRVTAGPAVWLHWYERIWPVSGSVAEPGSVTVEPPLVTMSGPALTAGGTLAPTE